MKTATAAAATVILAAGLVAAEPQHHALPSGTKINCAKPNASYCMGGDIILRCGPDALGEPARCSANVSGYPPAGGVAECWESSRDAGDAACQKNCVVYAENPFTLPADKCTPSATETGQPTSTGSTATSNWTSTGGSSSSSAASSSTVGSSSTASSSSGGGSSSTLSSGPPASSSTGSHTLPSSSTAPASTISGSSSSSAYISLPSPPPGTPPGTASTPAHTGNNSTFSIPIITGSTSTTRSTSSSSGGGGSIITLTSTAGPKPTATTPPPNSNDAAANNAMSGLFAFGLAVAALF
ncbi:hypothetical protein BB8028_0003g01470 [Beauveria bassiana]|uniref:Uncharacterized protein n=1 Tax=Beauveria bassiana TaxID=176275 RepID=A0A2S7Y6N9_BEABA|nr:hypothetical protein BB8028_0003g01470 [Beauveria bassiana]